MGAEESFEILLCASGTIVNGGQDSYVRLWFCESAAVDLFRQAISTHLPRRPSETSGRDRCLPQKTDRLRV